MIIDRIGQHEVLMLPINQNHNKIQERNQTSVSCFHKKKQQQCAHKHDNYKHDMYTVLLVLKSGW